MLGNGDSVDVKEKEWLESWMDTYVEDVPNHKKWYKFICLIMRRKLTYKELYIILCHINKKKDTEYIETQKNAMKQIMEIYNINSSLQSK